MLRGQCHERMQAYGEAIGDITYGMQRADIRTFTYDDLFTVRRAAKLKNDNVAAYYVLSQIQYKVSGGSGLLPLQFSSIRGLEVVLISCEYATVSTPISRLGHRWASTLRR